MDNFNNPFKPPNSAISPRSNTTSQGFYVNDKGVVFIPNGADLPCRCVICNAAPQMVKAKTFYWYSPILLLLIFINIFIFALIAFIMRRKFTLTLSYCEEHAAVNRKKQRLSWFSLGLFLIGLFISTLVSSTNYDGLFFPIMIVSFIILIAGIINGYQRIRAVKIDKEGIQIKGFGQPFLQSLR